MPAGSDYRPKDDLFIADLFFRERPKLLRYAQVIFQKRGGYVDPIGRAEDIVQEAFYLACEKRDDLIKTDDPTRWLVAAVTYKAREALREDRKWVQGLMLLPCEEPIVPFPEPEELSSLIPKEDYDLLRRLYVDGYTYKELCTELGVNKSNLGMRINRIKKSFKKKHGNIFS